MELSIREKEIIKAGKAYLEKNDVEGFYNRIIYGNFDVDPKEISNITQWFLDNKINVLSYCKDQVCDSMFRFTNIKYALIPDSVNFIAYCAFAESKVELMHLPTNLEIIEEGAFCYCKELIELIIPEGTKRIGDLVFVGCSKLTKVTLPQSLEYMPWNFEGCSPNLKIYVPKVFKNNLSVLGDNLNIDQIEWY